MWRESRMSSALEEAGHLFVLPLEGVVVADDAAALRAVLVSRGHAVRQMAQRCKRLLHV